MGALRQVDLAAAANDAASPVVLEALLDGRRLWKGRGAPARPRADAVPTGHAALDAALPGGGWPQAALSEILHPADGMGEIRLAWPALARLAQAGQRVVLVAPPHLPCAPAWRSAGVEPARLQLVQATDPREALWAAEQCLRSGSCGAVLCWPHRADDRALRRLQVAAETGRSLAFAWRPLAAQRNPSPAALRLAIGPEPNALRVLKCRGGAVPARPISLAQ